MKRTTPELALLSPNFRNKPAEGCLITDDLFNEQQADIDGGSSAYQCSIHISLDDKFVAPCDSLSTLLGGGTAAAHPTGFLSPSACFPGSLNRWRY
ncbi:hypothetical protein AVEN_274783-1 [Araneus ventricosus]|uniref:Uncharacterized protein n=1 Tax=Araneus ventricosus TaxID=182803 RepID=A0A4Y2J7W4_ARAVE|nr:hypothetical protein AVEN_274783-1 [Araneus ventricosus]